jgi:hypothetical protein
MSAGPPPLGPRRRRAAAAVVVAAVLGAAAATVAVDVAAVHLVGHSLVWPYRSLAARMRTTSWSAAGAVVAASVSVVLGAVLLALAVAPGRRLHRAVATDRPDEAAGMSERSVRRALAFAASEVDGVDGVSVLRRRRRLVVQVRTSFRDGSELRETVARAAVSCLDQLRLERPVPLEVRVEAAKGR